MYETFFGFSQRPFLPAPRVDRYYPGQGIEQSREMVARCIERAEGPVLVVGPTGTGKSMLCAVIAEQFRESMQVALLQCGRLCTRRALLQAVSYELGLPYREREEGELRLAIIDFVAELESSRQGVLLIVEEAHGLPLRLLEELRLMTNLIRDGKPCMRLVISGSHKLEERFASPKLESFNQRLAARVYLDSMDIEDTKQYVRGQLAAVDANPDKIFTEDGLDAIYRATDGIPRLINQVCDHALVLASAGGVQQINASGVEEAWADLQQLPLPWNEASPATDTGQTPESVIEFGALDEEEPASSTESLIGDAEGIEQSDPSLGSPSSLPFPAEERLDNRSDEMAEQAAEANLSAASADGGSETDHSSIEKQLIAIEGQLHDIEEEFQPIGSIGPEVELHFDDSQSAESADFDEELIIDRYAALDDVIFRNRSHVTNQMNREFAEVLQSVTPSQAARVQIAQVEGEIRSENQQKQRTTAETQRSSAKSQVSPAAQSSKQLQSEVQQYQQEQRRSAHPRQTSPAARMKEEVATDWIGEQKRDLDPVMPEEATLQANQFPPEPQQVTSSAPGKQTTGEMPESDADMFVVENEPAAGNRASQPVRRQEYRQLFAKLRHG